MDMKTEKKSRSESNSISLDRHLELQRVYFSQGSTLPVSVRRDALRKLKHIIRQREYDILEALRRDLGKSSTEGYMTEVGMVLEELSFMERNLSKWAKPKRVKTPLAQFHASSFVQPCPYGTVLIMSPWNYPFLLAMGPLVDALAAGNTVILKPSRQAPCTGAVMADLLREVFPEELVYTALEEREQLLEKKYDYIFFTGGKKGGRFVLEKAAVHLTPVSLELGGKSPCIVDETADLALAARRIIFGKFLNAGQTCVAPDYILVHRRVKAELLTYLKKEIRKQYGEDPLAKEDYGKIINRHHIQRLLGLMEGVTIAAGGRVDSSGRVEPTLLTDVTLDSPVMQEEIFGPLLPLLEFETWQDMKSVIEAHPQPLALYLFTRSSEAKRRVVKEIPFGGGCINDTIIHLASTHMGFGGVGQSGMGAYHGKAGFDTFTHYKSMIDKKLWIDMPIRYRPYTKQKERWMRFFMK